MLNIVEFVKGVIRVGKRIKWMRLKVKDDVERQVIF